MSLSSENAQQRAEEPIPVPPPQLPTCSPLWASYSFQAWTGDEELNAQLADGLVSGGSLPLHAGPTGHAQQPDFSLYPTGPLPWHIEDEIWTSLLEDAMASFSDDASEPDWLSEFWERYIANLHAWSSYFSGNNAQVALTAPLNNIFDRYRDINAVEADMIGTDGAISFFSEIGVQLDEVACIAVAELCQCPALGEFTREGFVSGWRSVNVNTVALMEEHAQTLRGEIMTDPAVFRRVYRFCFPLSRMQGQRNMQFEIATEQWRMFFNPAAGGVKANTTTTPWLDYWIEFLEHRGKKPVNKDLWEQFEVFLRKAHEDESFGWWDADGAWPGAIDDFVGFVQAKRAGAEMEVE